MRDKEPVVRLVPAGEPVPTRQFGALAGKVAVTNAFFETCEIVRQGFAALPISLEHAQVAGALSGTHRDPLNRMLIAQAREKKMALVSNEQLFDAFGVVRIW